MSRVFRLVCSGKLVFIDKIMQCNIIVDSVNSWYPGCQLIKRLILFQQSNNAELALDSLSLYRNHLLSQFQV